MLKIKTGSVKIFKAVSLPLLTSPAKNNILCNVKQINAGIYLYMFSVNELNLYNNNEVGKKTGRKKHETNILATIFIMQFPLFFY